MAQQSNKPTAVHFSLIFFVMTTLITTAGWWMKHKEVGENVSKTMAAEKAAGEATAALKNEQLSLEALKRYLGYTNPEVGQDSKTPGSILENLNNDLTTVGAPNNQVQPNMAAALKALRAALDVALEENRALQGSLKAEKERLTGLMALYQTDVTTEKRAKDAAKTDLEAERGKYEEGLREANKEVAKWTESYNTEQKEKESLRESSTRTEKGLNKELAELKAAIRVLRDNNSALSNDSFEVPDGKIVNVSSGNRLVWVNIGSGAHLRTQTTFSVYDQGSGKKLGGKDARDIKGKIEIVQVTDKDRSVARILSEDANRPISENDLIYSPIWQQGRPQHFAFVGHIDLNGDPKDDENDRLILHSLLENAGARIDVEIDDVGKCVPEDGKIDVGTHFLVIGRRDDVLLYKNDAAKKEEINAIEREITALSQEAERNGVRTIKLDDFLGYIGYEAQNRSFQPGNKFSLKAASGKAQVAGPPESRDALVKRIQTEGFRPSAIPSSAR